MLLSADRVLLDEAGPPRQGWIQTAGERIAAVGHGAAPGTATRVDGIVVPGLVDTHAHGGGGASFATEDAGQARQALAAHRARGVTTVVASLVTARLDELVRQVGTLAGLVEAGELAGIHLEGPWLSAAYCGAHPRSLLRDPDPATLRRLLQAGRGTIRMVTVAPERGGALPAIRMLADAGVVAAVGHTGADYDTTRAALTAGARAATHLFNAMAPLRHREPGPVLALWEDERVTLELILDGVHLHPQVARLVMQTASGRVVLVSDAMAAAAASDGDYRLGEARVQVRAGVARLAGTDTIAGSTLTLDRAVRTAVDAGVPLASAVAAATAAPADHLNLVGVGRIAAGNRADLVVLDDDLAVSRVMWRGVWLQG